ncbi:hypothetical protein P7B02_07145 [Caulobacter segnis]|uniref:hypothetical protein n=1 Tax=Caulobacter segnis TaxID=88688 RepID=UPI002410A48E|nr:hypothetical protein [Caulobacter segnis]MDG2521315.1 hypothetical protein [Caulobacter segnis]
MSCFSHRSARGGDRHLASLFRENATEFLSGVEDIASVYPREAGHMTSIAMELALKSHLLAFGVSDDWNRTHLRHDLTKALRCARRAGLVEPPGGMAAVAALFTPYYTNHAFNRFPTTLFTAADWRHAAGAVRAVIGDAP